MQLGAQGAARAERRPQPYARDSGAVSLNSGSPWNLACLCSRMTFAFVKKILIILEHGFPPSVLPTSPENYGVRARSC